MTIQLRLSPLGTFLEASLEGIADGIGVVRSALFQPMSVLEEEGLIMTRQAHVIGAAST